MLRFAWVLMLLAPFACHRGSKAPADEAMRFELGSGVARDYTRALRVYEDRCDDGRGDSIACRKLALAVLSGRGEPRQPVDARALLATACQHGDWLACGAPRGQPQPEDATQRTEEVDVIPGTCPVIKRRRS